MILFQFLVTDDHRQHFILNSNECEIDMIGKRLVYSLWKQAHWISVGG